MKFDLKQRKRKGFYALGQYDQVAKVDTTYKLSQNKTVFFFLSSFLSIHSLLLTNIYRNSKNNVNLIPI